VVGVRLRKTLPADIEQVIASGDVEAVARAVARCEIGAYLRGSAYEPRLMHFPASEEITDFLLARGEDINSRDRYQRTPIHARVQSRCLDQIPLLIARGGDINARDTSDQTALFDVVERFPVADVSRMIAWGADPLVVADSRADGNATLVDDFGGNKQLITVTTKNGNYFYILIDRDDEGEDTVHFLNQVDEADLLALMEDGSTEAAPPAVCSCTDKCEAGKVNVSCPVCKDNMTACSGKEAEPETEKPTEQPKEKGNTGGLVLFLVVALLGGGGAFYYFKFMKPKQNVKGDTDLEDFDFDDYDEDEGDGLSDEEQEDEEA